MNDFKETLIEFYASSKEGLLNSPEFEKFCEKYKSNRLFHRFREEIEIVKVFLKETVEKQATKKGEIAECLKAMNRLALDKSEDLLDSYQKLIFKAYGKDWNQNQIDYFELTLKLLIKTKWDYFLSFTRRKYAQGENIVNNNYQLFIDDILREKIEAKEKMEENLLSKSIHIFLKKKGFKGFFYPEHIGDNRIVSQKIKDACNDCLVFIQLIQNIIFEKKDSENYCYNEYMFTKDNFEEKRIKFIIVGSREELKKDYEICLEYDGWHKHVLKKDAIILEFPDNMEKVKNLKEQIKRGVCDEIKNYREELINNAPSH